VHTDESRGWVQRHRRLLVVASALTVIAASAGGWFVREWARRGPTEASVPGAIERFRSSSTVPSSVARLVPTPGVYTFAGDGQENLSFMATHQQQGRTLPATVTHATNNCWRFEIEYNTFHRQTWNWCARDGRLIEQGGTTHQQFDFVAFKVDENSTVVCDPPFTIVDTADRPGHTTTSSCRGHSTTSGTDMLARGTVKFVGAASIDVGGTPVPALHYHADRRISAAQTGHEVSDFWFSAANGMLLRNERDIRVVSPAPAPLHTVTYTERGWFQLAALTPRS